MALFYPNTHTPKRRMSNFCVTKFTPPHYNHLIFSHIILYPVKLFILYENFIRCIFTAVSNQKTNYYAKSHVIVQCSIFLCTIHICHGRRHNGCIYGKCLKCILFPICDGGCPYYRLQTEFEGVERDNCPLIKSNLKDFLLMHYHKKRQETDR